MATTDAMILKMGTVLPVMMAVEEVWNITVVEGLWEEERTEEENIGGDLCTKLDGDQEGGRVVLVVAIAITWTWKPVMFQCIWGQISWGVECLEREWDLKEEEFDLISRSTSFKILIINQCVNLIILCTNCTVSISS